MTAGQQRACGSPLFLLSRPSVGVAIVVAGLAAMACGGGAPDPAEVVLSVGYSAYTEAGVATGLDQLIDQLTGDSLVRAGPDGRVEPMLAESWSVDRNGKSVTVALRPDVTFHDGSPLTSTDVKATLDRLRTHPFRRARNPVLGDIESIETTGPHAIHITLSRPSGQLLLFALGVRIEKRGPGDQRIAAGPFYVKTATDHETTLQAHPDYYLGRSHIETVRILTYSTLRTAWAAMMRSEIDFLFNIPIEAREFVEADSNVRVFSRDRPYAYALLFNARRPPFDDRRVRVALSYAVDRDAITEGAFRGHSSVASGVWASHWVYDGRTMVYDHQPQRADQLLAEVGLMRPVPGQEWDATGFPSRLRFNVLVGVDQARLETIALLVQNQLRRIGVDMAVEAMPFAAVLNQLSGDSWDAVLLEINTARNLGRLFAYWHSSGQYAISGFTGTDDVLESLRSSATEADMETAASAFQRRLFEEAPAIFLTSLGQARALSRRFVVPDEPGRDVVETLWRWRVDEDAPTN